MLVHIVFVCLFQQAVAVPFAPQWPTHSQLEVTSEETNPTSQSGQKLHADPNNGMMKKKIRTSLAVREVYSDGVVHEADLDEETWDVTWHDLSPEQQQDWKKLGWNEEMWDKGEKEPDTYDLDWNQLPDDQKRAAVDLGYDEQTWNDEEEDANDAAEGDAAEEEDTVSSVCDDIPKQDPDAFADKSRWAKISTCLGVTDQLSQAEEQAKWKAYVEPKVVSTGACLKVPDFHNKESFCDLDPKCNAALKAAFVEFVDDCIPENDIVNQFWKCRMSHFDDHCKKDTEAPAECVTNYRKDFIAFVEAHKSKVGSAEKLQAALTEIFEGPSDCIDTGFKDDAWKSKLVDENKCASLPDKDAKRLICDEGSECIASVKEEAQQIVNTCISEGIKTFKENNRDQYYAKVLQLDLKFQHDWFTCIVDHIDDHCQ